MLTMEYKTSTKLVDYQQAFQFMEQAVTNWSAKSKNMIWFLEHPSLYTEGVSASKEELLDRGGLPIYKTNRGGKFIYHGPGQRIAYLVLDLKKIFAPNSPDIKKYVYFLEQIVVEILKELGIVGVRLPGNPGIWIKVNDKSAPKKIAFIGIRIKKWISYHGVAFNISPNLDHFKGIIPCGLKEYEITSLKELGKEITAKEFDGLFKKNFEKLLKKGI